MRMAAVSSSRRNITADITSWPPPMMPPVVISLIWSTPCRICSRTAWTKASAPSTATMRRVPPNGSCPAVVRIASPQQKSRGPTNRPAANASRQATSAHPDTPTTRSDVTPADSASIAFRPCSSTESGKVWTGSRPVHVVERRWVWTSQSPGRSQAPPRSSRWSARGAGP